MNESIDGFFESLRGKRIAMLGIGVSNTPLVGLFISYGAHVTVCDRRTRENLGPAAGELESAGAALKLGENYLKDLDVDIIYRTPGMRYYLPELNEARSRGVAVTSEMETFFELCPCKVIAVTGSDGKTTTTTLIAEMLRKHGRRVHLGGNIGRALLPIIHTVSPDDVAVVELSSFQLISMRRSPDIAVVTNVSPNHLDMHKNMEEYISAKKNIILHQNAFGRAVLNLDNPITSAMAGDARGAVFYFSRTSEVALGCFVNKKGDIIIRDRAGEHKVMSASDILLPGLHNVENYLAAIAAVWGLADTENITYVARNFPGVEHRMELIRELDGVRYYNDSIATTPTRTIAGLEAYVRKVILIAGGSDKNIPFEPLGKKAVEKVKCLILIGFTADKIEAAVKAAPGYAEGHPEIIKVGGLKEAVETARAHAEPGDIVTLSPACASFDMFKNFEERGEIFKEIVKSMKV